MTDKPKCDFSGCGAEMELILVEVNHPTTRPFKWVCPNVEQHGKAECTCEPIERSGGALLESNTCQMHNRPNEVSTFDLITHLNRQKEFSEKTFGPGMRTAGVIDHIRKELEEVSATPNDLEEWVDLVLLSFDGAWRSGHTPEQIAAGIETKQTKNEGRTWPDWRTADPDKGIQHVKSPAQVVIVPALKDTNIIGENEVGAIDQMIETLGDSINQAVEDMPIPGIDQHEETDPVEIRGKQLAEGFGEIMRKTGFDPQKLEEAKLLTDDEIAEYQRMIDFSKRSGFTNKFSWPHMQHVLDGVKAERERAEKAEERLNESNSSAAKFFDEVLLPMADLYPGEDLAFDAIIPKVKAERDQFQTELAKAKTKIANQRGEIIRQEGCTQEAKDSYMVARRSKEQAQRERDQLQADLAAFSEGARNGKILPEAGTPWGDYIRGLETLVREIAVSNPAGYVPGLWVQRARKIFPLETEENHE